MIVGRGEAVGGSNAVGRALIASQRGGRNSLPRLLKIRG